MRRTIAVLLGALLCAAQGWSADVRRIDLPWNEIGPRVGNNKVSMALPGGVYIEGRIREVAPEGLRMKISKTSNTNAQPKGVHVIPRGSVSVLRVTEYRKIGRLVGTLGAAGAAAGIAAANYPDLYEGSGGHRDPGSGSGRDDRRGRGRVLHRQAGGQTRGGDPGCAVGLPYRGYNRV